ncbi:MAG: hypothetical protein M3360_06500 [Actinomycetota bacterium]|nr:hypothetical protein [Actinomycetota bacterium]
MNQARTTLLLTLLALFAGACSDVSFVEAVTVVNRTDYPARVEVSNASREEWLGLTFTRADAETVVQDVIDQGEVWVFRFGYGSRHEEQFTISRSDLVKADWRVEVPQSFEESLRELSVEPPA